MNKQDWQRYYRYSLSLTGDQDSAYDLLQECALKISHAHEAGKAKAYIYTILRNKHIDFIRQQQRRPETPIDDENEIVPLDVSDMGDMIMKQQDLERLLAQLDSDSRQLIYLHYVEEWTTQELAEKLNSPRGTILARLHRIRQRLKRLLQEDQRHGQI